MAKTDKVKMRIEKIPGVLMDDVIIGINGVNYQIPRGKQVEVPAFVKAEYDRSVKAQERLYDTEKKFAYVGPDKQTAPVGGIVD